MKVAYHFDSRHSQLGTVYGLRIEEVVLKVLLRQPPIRVNTKVFVGDLLLRNLASDTERTTNGVILRPNTQKFAKVVDEWLMPAGPVWFKDRSKICEAAVHSVIYLMCFEALDDESAQELHKRLEMREWYLGAIEVDDSSAVHWYLYSAGLVPAYRIWYPSATVFWDGISEDSKDEGRRQLLEARGFTLTKFESLEGRYTIFDSYDNYEHARRVAIWKRRMASLLGFIADDVVTRLSDIAPELGDKLYAALKAFNGAETGEGLAQVVTSCRRIFEYVSDQLFPPSTNSSRGHDLGPKRYKNRLIAYAEQQRTSNTEIAMVSAELEVWAAQVDKLYNLANKGVHTEVLRSETRRCLLRTVLLLDDIVSFKPSPFQVEGHFNIEVIKEIVLRDPLGENV